MMNIDSRLQSLRAEMKKRGIPAYLIAGSDPHLSEYVSARWKTREWISRFSGSAGTIIVTMDKAALWTDFRYWIQAEKELKGTSFLLFRQGEPGVPEPMEWVKGELKKGDALALNGWEVSADQGSTWSRELDRYGIGLEEWGDLLEPIWEERPLESMDSPWEHPLSLAGESRTSKLQRLRWKIENSGGKSLWISALEEQAWLLNWRGTDIPYNPFLRSFTLILPDQVKIFTELERIPQDLKDSLEADGCSIHPYHQAEQEASKDIPGPLFYHPQKTPWVFLHFFKDSCRPTGQFDLVAPMQAVKNEKEIDAFRAAMVKDGVAMVRFQIWLEQQMESKQKLSEWDCAQKITQLREEQEGFQSNSFAPITAFGANAASCHYEADPQEPIYLGDNGAFLLDSGGQYPGATTDITRTYHLGEPSQDFRRFFTLVLKGHIQLAMAKFPRGTRGYQLDTLARIPLWQDGLDYGHGTGHGVGAQLGVHEGPQSLSPKPIDVPLEPGMVLSNEPGYYKEGSMGIRLENLILVREDHPGDKDSFLSFETLTLCPFQAKSIDLELLEPQEILWLKEYHHRVYKTLGKKLNHDELKWLERNGIF